MPTIDLEEPHPEPEATDFEAAAHVVHPCVCKGGYQDQTTPTTVRPDVWKDKGGLQVHSGGG